MNDFVKNLKPGDAVIRWSWAWTGSNYFETKVSHITPKGFINVDGFLFKPDGHCRGGGQALLDPSDPKTQKLLEKYKQDRAIQAAINKMWNCKKSDLDYEKAIKIIKILQEDSK